MSTAWALHVKEGRPCNRASGAPGLLPAVAEVCAHSAVPHQRQDSTTVHGTNLERTVQTHPWPKEPCNTVTPTVRSPQAEQFVLLRVPWCTPQRCRMAPCASPRALTWLRTRCPRHWNRPQGPPAAGSARRTGAACSQRPAPAPPLHAPCAPPESPRHAPASRASMLECKPQFPSVPGSSGSAPPSGHLQAYPLLCTCQPDQCARTECAEPPVSYMRASPRGFRGLQPQQHTVRPKAQWLQKSPASLSAECHMSNFSACMKVESVLFRQQQGRACNRAIQPSAPALVVRKY